MSNLTLFLPYAGANAAVDSAWTLKVKHYTVSKMRAVIPSIRNTIMIDTRTGNSAITEIVDLRRLRVRASLYQGALGLSSRGRKQDPARLNRMAIVQKTNGTPNGQSTRRPERSSGLPR